MNVAKPVSAGKKLVGVHPMSGYTGAEISDVDVRHPLAAADIARIRQALLQWKVVFFRDQDITQEQHIAFGSQFGQVTPAHPTLPAAFPEHPEILLLDNSRSDSKHRSRIDSLWHSDATFVTNPPMASILRCVVVPEYGGDTHWTNAVAAYNDLSDVVKATIDGLHAVHQNSLQYDGDGADSEQLKALQSKEVRSVHPVVRVHPETGEKGLFVNPLLTSHIVGISGRESDHLLALLYEQLSDPVYTVRFRWRPGSIAFWDNRSTAHLVPHDVPNGMPRSMQRITLAGDVPVGPDGFTSTAIVGDSFN